jgi:carbon starvation protein
MLIEAALATLIIIAVAAGIGMGYKTGQGNILTGIAAWEMHYSSWTASSGLGAKIGAVVTGSANMIAALGIPKTLGMVIMGVFIASFAGTTLDSATRIQRYVVTELFTDMKIKFMTNKYAATAFAVITAAALAFASGADGKGALKLWPMFGAINQLLASLTLLVITIYLKRKGGYRYLVSGLPCVFMLAMTIWGVVINQLGFVTKANWPLAVINGIILALSVWMIIESTIVFGFLKRLKKS